MARLFRFTACFAAVMLAASAPGLAQQKKPPAKAHTQGKPQKGQPQTAAPAAPAQQPELNPFKMNMLIRSAIIALNQANITGNYTVLQDLGSPSFRASNNSARLAQIFANLRQRNLDLSPILFFTPKLVQPPQINANGILRLVGYFPTSPEHVNFDLYFQMVGGDWRIFGIGLSTSPADITAAVPQDGQTNPAAANAGANGQAAPQDEAGHAAQANVAPPPAPKAAPRPARKPAAAAGNNQWSTQESGGAAADGAVENRTTNNATRIDLSKVQAEPFQTQEEETPPDAGSQPKSGFWDGFNPFSRN